jgi:hypothetical protein
MLLSFLFDRELCIMPTHFACYMIVILIGVLSIVKPRLLVIDTHTIYWPKYTLLITKYNKEINKHRMLKRESMNKQLLYHFYYGHNLCFHIAMQYSHLRGMSTKEQYRSYLPKTEYTIKRYCNCLSNIAVLVMLIKLYYVWYIRIFIIYVSAFSIIVFLSNYYSPRSFDCAWSLH